MDGWKLEDVISSWEGLFFRGPGLCQFQISGRVNHQNHLPKFWFDSLNPEAAKVVPAVHAASTLAQGQVSCAKDQARWEEVMDAYFSKSHVFWDVMDFQTKQRFDESAYFGSFDIIWFFGALSAWLWFICIPVWVPKLSTNESMLDSKTFHLSSVHRTQPAKFWTLTVYVIYYWWLKSG